MISFSSGLVTMWCFGKFLFKSDFLCGFSTTEEFFWEELYWVTQLFYTSSLTEGKWVSCLSLWQLFFSTTPFWINYSSQNYSFFPSLGRKISCLPGSDPYSILGSSSCLSLSTLVPAMTALFKHAVSEALGNWAKGSSDRSMCNTWLTEEKHLVCLARNWFKQRFSFASSKSLRHWSVLGGGEKSVFFQNVS